MFKNSTSWRRKNITCNLEVLCKNWKEKNLFLGWIVHFQHMQFHLLLIEVIWGQRAQLFQRGMLSFRGVKGFTQDHQTCKCQWLRFWSRCTWLHHTSQSFWKVKLLNKCKSYQEWKYSLALVKTNKEILTNHSSQDQNCFIFKIKFFKCQLHSWVYSWLSRAEESRLLWKCLHCPACTALCVVLSKNLSLIFDVTLILWCR